MLSRHHPHFRITHHQTKDRRVSEKPDLGELVARHRVGGSHPGGHGRRRLRAFDVRHAAPGRDLLGPIQNPSGNLLISSDLPLQGAGRSQTVQMTKAIAFEFASREVDGGQVHDRLPEL